MFAEKTRVPVSQSRSEIERLLERHKAQQYGTAVDYAIQQARVSFRMASRVVRFTIALPDAKKYGNGARRDQLERQRWRALLLVIKAKLEAVENGIETFEQAFLANVVLPNDQTVAEAIAPAIAEAYKAGRMPRALLPPAEEKVVR